MRYTESYYNLSHGTDIVSAEDIKTNGFALRGDKTSWCGEGVYFYDIKAKAWWAAKRKCNELKQKGKGSIKATVILADIEDIYKDETFDLRVKKDLDDFESFVNSTLSDDYKIIIEGVDDEVERKILLRSMLIVVDVSARPGLSLLSVGKGKNGTSVASWARRYPLVQNL